LLVFPGEISKDRARDPSYFADYKIDINDVSTCPKQCSWSGTEFWNESSYIIRWFFGRIIWACMIDMDSYVLKNGFFGVGIGVVRYQNIPDVSDLRDLAQLKQAVICAMGKEIAEGLYLPFSESSFSVREVSGREWLIARTLNGMGYPEYRALLPIDERTVIHIPAVLDNCWQPNETIPNEVEQKHLASFWDFLSQVHLISDQSGGWQVGSQAREAPGHALKEDDFQW
jgi:hypothetical protein